MTKLTPEIVEAAQIAIDETDRPFLFTDKERLAVQALIDAAREQLGQQAAAPPAWDEKITENARSFLDLHDRAVDTALAGSNGEEWEKARKDCASAAIACCAVFAGHIVRNADLAVAPPPVGSVEKERERCAILAAAWPTAPYASEHAERLSLQKAYLDISRAIRDGAESVPAFSTPPVRPEK